MKLDLARLRAIYSSRSNESGYHPDSTMAAMKRSRSFRIISRWLALALLLNAATAGAMGLERTDIARTFSIESPTSCHQQSGGEDTTDDSDHCSTGCVQCVGSVVEPDAVVAAEIPVSRYYSVSATDPVAGFVLPLFKPPRLTL